MAYRKIREYDGGGKYYFAHEKKDGYWVEVCKYEDGTVEIFKKKRDVNIWDNLKPIPHIREAIKNLPNCSSLQCELYSPGISASSVITMIKSSDPKLRLCPFAAPIYGGKDGGCLGLLQFNNVMAKLGFDTAEIIPLKRGRVREDDLLDMAVDRKIEGWVLKTEHLGKWVKLKPVRTVDAVVVRSNISKSISFEGGLKAITVAVYDKDKEVVIASVSCGFTIDYRMSVHADSLIGKVAEIQYDSICAKGRLRFPVFLRWRDDEKTAKECTIEQLYAA